MDQTAITIDNQLALLKSRGLIVADDSKAKEVLEDIGFYRLGFYLFPLELSYPNLHHRTHIYKDGSTLETAVRLYYFDFDLRILLLKYLSRIEVNFRTVLTYEGSIAHKDDRCWFVNPNCVNVSFIKDFDRMVYNSTFRRNPTIKRHHKNHPEQKYAPAWKTIELMTLGETVKLYCNLSNPFLKRTISQRYGIKYVDVFENYIELIRIIRNACAHGSILFDFKPYKRIKRGPASLTKPEEYLNLYGSIKVVSYMLAQVSLNRTNDFLEELQGILDRYMIYPEIMEIIEKSAGLPVKVTR